MCVRLRFNQALKRVRTNGLVALVMTCCFVVSVDAQEVPLESEVSPKEHLISDLEADRGPILRDSESRLSDVAIPLQIGSMPGNNRPLIEIGDSFLGNGPIGEGFDIGTGAIWNPRFWVFGTFRTAIQGFDDGDEFRSEWANRLDLFGNLQLTATERILIGFRPLDFRGREFSGFTFSPDSADGFDEGFNARITTLFFEGDLGEIFPGLDDSDSSLADFGFAIGRQELLVQRGILIDDTVDAVGLTRNTLVFDDVANLRMAFYFAWHEVNRSNRARDNDANLFGLFNEADFGESTVGLDIAFVTSTDDGSDGFFFGLSTTQRFGHLNTTFRVLGSIPLQGETPKTQEGYLLFAELSWTPTGTEDLYYANVFLGIDDFSSAARAPDRSGPLSRTGILYTAQGLGQFGAALDADPGDSLGFSFGRQFFWNDFRDQIILEVGGRLDTNDSDEAAVAAGIRFQHAMGENFILQVNLHAAVREERKPNYGLRMELLIKF